jgi:hypothetical protein
MNLRRLLRIAFAISVTVGLTLAPLAAPAAAAQARLDGMSDMSMSADMPCCPDDQKSNDCPLVAICVLKTTQAGPSEAVALPLRHAIRTSHSVADDAVGDGLVRPPPDQPPRTLA